MDAFSWKDGVHATLGACLPCFRSSLLSTSHSYNDNNNDNDDDNLNENGSHNRGRVTPYARYTDELEGLLGDSTSSLASEHDGDAETLSLHSNVGTGSSGRKKNRRRKNRKGMGMEWATKSVQLFGFHLFGRPTPPIQLPESDSENDDHDDVEARRRRRRERNRRRERDLGRLGIATATAHHHLSSSMSLSSASSPSTPGYDADAAPLDAAAIARLSAQEAEARAEREAEEERRRSEEERERVERRRRRRERREVRKSGVGAAVTSAETEAGASVTAVTAAEAGPFGLGGAGEGNGKEEFEGFQGSGSASGIGSPYVTAFGREGADTYASLPPSVGDDFGPYVQNVANNDIITTEDDTEDADFGGTVYTRSTRSRGSNSGSSASRSQTSASRSNAGSVNQDRHSTPSSPFGNTTFSHTPHLNLLRPHQHLGHAKSASGSVSVSNTTSTSSAASSGFSPTASPSLGSPVQPAFVFTHPEHQHEQGPLIVSHDETDGDGEVQRFDRGALSGLEVRKDVSQGVGVGMPSPGFTPSAFPSVGFGGVRRTNTNSSGLGAGSGVFLARMGED